MHRQKSLTNETSYDTAKIVYRDYDDTTKTTARNADEIWRQLRDRGETVNTQHGNHDDTT